MSLCSNIEAITRRDEAKRKVSKTWIDNAEIIYYVRGLRSKTHFPNDIPHNLREAVQEALLNEWLVKKRAR